MNILRYTLIANAVFSIVSGSSIIIFRKSMSEIFGVSGEGLWWIVGSILILFSLSVLDQVRKKQQGKIHLIIGLDLLWVISSIVLVLVHPAAISSTGYGLITIVALLVLCFATGQWYGLKLNKQLS